MKELSLSVEMRSKNLAIFLAPCGMSQMELIEMAGGFEGVPEKVISGGPMMGFAIFSTEVPVTKTSSAILGFSKDEVKKHEPSACINCGRCVDACPSRIVPSRLADFAERHDEESFLKWEGLECVWNVVPAVMSVRQRDT